MTMTAEICISLWVLFNEAHITGMTTARAIKKYLLSTTQDVIMLVVMQRWTRFGSGPQEIYELVDKTTYCHLAG